jgi:AraC family transcriptional regulator, transcriptional activator of pobA
VRAPHRHDYHELIWLRSGFGEHVVDGVPAPVCPGTVTIIGRGQVHQFREAKDLHGAILRFGDELLYGDTQRIATGWLLAGRGGRSVEVPPEARDELQATLEILLAETEREPDAYSIDLQRNIVTNILLRLERWYDGSRSERRDADDADVQLHRRFAALLERDYAAHHDVAHYADALGVPPAALAKALTEITGRPTKELVLERVMLEAARLLQFTDLTVGEVAFRVGFEDQLYFSRAFKRRFGRPPVAYRRAVRGGPI